jgi:predicted permease
MSPILDSVLPIFALIGLGRVLKHVGFIDEQFLNVSDRLIYFILFPAMLFWKIGSPSGDATDVDWALVTAAVGSIFTVFVGSLVFAKLTSMDHYHVGSFAQACFRFNTYVGMAVVLTSLGEPGVKCFGILIGFVIPLINVLSVGTLIWFSGEDYAFREKTLIFLKALVLNPLILACIAGMLYSRLHVPLPRFVENTLSLMSVTALPLALVSIGGSLTFEGLRKQLKPALVADIFKLVLLPVIGYLLLRLFQVSDTSFKVGMIYFALPTTPSIYILSRQLHSDLDLATAAVVLSVLLSIGSLSAVLIVFVG